MQHFDVDSSDPEVTMRSNPSRRPSEANKTDTESEPATPSTEPRLSDSQVVLVQV